ncbi:MAG: hypothetical protein RR386_09620, partial [Bacteroidaceae bacterium]
MKQPNTKKKTNNDGFSFWAKNLGAVLLVYVLLLKIPTLNVGYDWIVNNYLKGNLEMVRENPNLTNEERMSAKMGGDFSFLLFLRNSTPENAVILYPTKADFTHEFMGQKSPFTGNIV